MLKALKVGFIGGGVNSAVGQAHKIALQMDGNFDLVAGCFSRDREINIKTANAWRVDVSRIYATYKDLLQAERGRLDAVVVLTPTPTHKEIVIESIKAGFSVICEKALACRASDAEEIRACLNKYKGYLAVTYNYSGYPMVRELRKRIAAGELGKLEQILVEMPQEGFARLNPLGRTPCPQAWRLADKDIPVISLDLGVHLHQMIDFLTNEKPIEVMSIVNRFGSFESVCDTVHCLSRYTNGLVCNMWYGKAALGYRNGLRVRVLGTHGSAEWLQMDPEHLHFSDNMGNVQVVDRVHAGNTVANQKRYERFKAGHPAGFLEAFANYYEDIAVDMASNAPNEYVIGLDVALEGLEMLERIHNSALRG